MGLQAAMRAAAVTLLLDYGASAGIRAWSVTPTRPTEIRPPHAFVDTIGETLDHTTARTDFRFSAEVVVIHGISNPSGYTDAAIQRDAFMDGFIEWAEARYHAAGANTMLGISSVDDLPNWQPDWSDTETRTFYATRILLEGNAPSQS
jgi:hypothetical protein